MTALGDGRVLVLRHLTAGIRPPGASNDREYGREQNRRVEVAIFASEDYRKELAKRNGSGSG
jgi:hypothetical protein